MTTQTSRFKLNIKSGTEKFSNQEQLTDNWNTLDAKASMLPEEINYTLQAGDWINGGNIALYLQEVPVENTNSNTLATVSIQGLQDAEFRKRLRRYGLLALDFTDEGKLQFICDYAKPEENIVVKIAILNR